MKLLNWLNRSATKHPEDLAILGFDPDFYLARYADLKDLKDPRALRRHYLLHGKSEGRFGSLSQAVSYLQRSYGKLPSDFDPEEYRAAHRDLAEMPVWEAVEHYLRYGRQEGRFHRRFNCEIYRELYFANQIISDEELRADYQSRGRAEGKIASGADILKSKGMQGGGRWIEALKIDEFILLNYSWAESIATRMDAVIAMLSKGISLLAPISFALDFDPVFYREIHPLLASAADDECYRHWLFVGFEKGEPGSEEQFFRELGVPLHSFPESFRWKEYLRQSSIEGSRWTALRHFIREGFEKGARTVSGSDAFRLFTSLGVYFRNRNDALAIEAFELARGFAPIEGHLLQDLGDCYYRQKQWALAVEAYGSRMRYPGADVWTFCNLTRAALKLKKIDLAFGVLKESKNRVVGSPEWRKVLIEAINAEFEVASLEAHELLHLGLRPEADRIMTEAVSHVARRFADFDPLGVPVPVGPTAKVALLANVDLRQCTHYRVEQKEQLFQSLGLEYQIFAASEAEQFITALPGVSAAIFYRLPAFPMNVRAIEVARSLGIPTYYEIDDLIFESSEYPEPFETYGGAITGDFYQMLQFGTPLFRAAMALCDYGIASTHSLAKHMKPVVRKHKVFVLPNGLDERNSRFLDRAPSRVRQDGSIIIFYGSGTNAHNSDFLDLAGPALLEVMKRESHVKLMIVGYLSLGASFDHVCDRVIRVGWLPDVNAYWSLLAEADINIAVLGRYATTDAKSEIKWLEAAAMGIPSIVSGTAHYREVLQNGVDVLMADDPQSWSVALERLIADPGFRKKIAERAKDTARALYSVEANAKKLRALLPVPEETKWASSNLSRAKRRILLVNIFFPPQTLGGSTRVVRDNLDSFLDGAAARQFDFAVVTTDLGGEGFDHVRVENYRGCPVFRISTPNVPPMEWWPVHPRIGNVFRKILGFWQPDLVHFHCVQRLSAAIVEECLKADIPYINTVHDAWWVSDWQFLTDIKDRLRQPGEFFPFDPPPPSNVGQSLDRRRLLSPLLANSAAILAVSKAFAEIYRSCGYPETIAVPNGTPPLNKTSRVASASGRVRLAHVGSMTKFKGYFMVQAVLKLGQFKNVELTVVDHSRYGGEESVFTWGATPVRFVGKTLQEGMHEFYAWHDVLLAPSLWPEPYGLVTREALSAGLWVLASDRGAIGEDVMPGLNGWIVDVATPKAMLAVLAEIDSNPAKYLQSPPTGPLRTANDQAAELFNIYIDVLSRQRVPIQPYVRRTVEEDIGRPRTISSLNLKTSRSASDLQT